MVRQFYEGSLPQPASRRTAEKEFLINFVNINIFFNFFFVMVWGFDLCLTFFLVALRRNDCIVNMPLFLAAGRITMIFGLKKARIFKPALPGKCSTLGVEV